MKTNVLISVVFMAVIIFVTGCDKKNSKAELKTFTDSACYVIGTNIGTNLNGEIKRSPVKINKEALLQGMKDALDSTEVFSQEEKENILKQFQMDMQKKQMEEMTKKAGPNKQRGAQFLAENKKRQGVVELPSGLQYEVIKEGKGNNPKPTDIVTVHYVGTLIDGTVFESSREQGQPAVFPLNQVIPGWTEGIQLMKPGAIYKFYIPSDLAYGDQERSDKIQPGVTLVFEVELISAKAQEQQQQN